MPAAQKDAYPIVPRTPSPHRLRKLSPSADRYCKLRPSLLMLSKRKQPKKLKWAPGIVDNEKRPKSKTVPVKTDGTKPSTLLKPSSNTSAKMSPLRHHSPTPNHQNRSPSPHARRDKSRAKTPPALPPRVPDAPRPKPPPAPRPRRLLTPDLPEIDGEFFGPALDIVRRIKPEYSKMDAQLEAAMAYMQQGRRKR